MFVRPFQLWLWLLTAGILWGGNLYANEWDEELRLREKVDLQLQLRAKRYVQKRGDSSQTRQAVQEGFQFLYSVPSHQKDEKMVDWIYLKDAIQTLANKEEDVGIQSALVFLEKCGHTVSLREQYLHTALKNSSQHSPQCQVLRRWGNVSRFLEMVGKLEKCHPIFPEKPQPTEENSTRIELLMLASPTSRNLEVSHSLAGEKLSKNLSIDRHFSFSLTYFDNHVVQQKRTVVLLI